MYEVFDSGAIADRGWRQGAILGDELAGLAMEGVRDQVWREEGPELHRSVCESYPWRMESILGAK